MMTCCTSPYMCWLVWGLNKLDHSCWNLIVANIGIDNSTKALRVAKLQKTRSYIYNRLTNWKRLYPSRLEKKFIAKLSLYSCIWYYTQSMEVPADFRSGLKTMINSFLWPTRKKHIDQRSRAHTQMARMCQKPDKGGCKFLDLDSQINKCLWR